MQNLAPAWLRQATSLLTIAALLILSVSVMFAAPSYAEAAISYESVASAANDDDPGDDEGSLEISAPTSVASGDFLLAGIAINGGDETSVSTPSGWTLIERTDNDDDLMFATYYKVAGGSEPASYTWEFDGNDDNDIRAAGGIIRYTGVDTSSPIDEKAENEGFDDEFVAPSVGTDFANDLVVVFYAQDDDNTHPTPSGTTERYDVENSNNNGPRTSAADFFQVVAGSTGTKTIDSGSSTEDWIAQTVALKPALTSQTITVGTSAPGSAVYGSSFGVAATASSGLEVDITTSGGSCSATDTGTGTATVTMTSGTGSCVVHYNQAGNGTYSAAPEVTESVTPQVKGLTVTGLTADDKTYDGNNSATLSGAAALSGVINDDDVTLGGSPVAIFSDEDAGSDKAVSVTGYTHGGSDAGNYSLTQPSFTADILQKNLSFTVDGQDKVYDGITDADVAFSTSDVVGGDSVGFSYSASFDTADVGTDKPIAVSSITLTGADAANYSNATGATAETSADITEAAADVDFTGDSEDLNVIYDGSPHSLASLFETDPSGLDLVITYDGSVTAPTAVGEYEVIATVDEGQNYAGSNTQTLVIDPASLEITADNQSKTYGTEFTFEGDEFTVDGLVGEDSVSGADLGSDGAPASADVGDYEITIEDAEGDGLSNYTISYFGAEFVVNPADLFVTPDNKNKVVGTLFTEFTGTVTGLQNEDEVSVTYDSTGAPVEASVGSYPITADVEAGEGVLDNYNVIIDEEATLTVTETPEEPEPEPEAAPDSDATGGGGGIVGLVNSFNAPGFQPGSVLGAFTTAEQEQGSATSTGEVLGASTSELAQMCKESRLITSNLGLNRSNPVDQVKLLQAFLNAHQNAGLPESGVFGPMTFGAVKTFQAANAEEILTPWGLTEPTGYVGILTRYMIDKIICAAVYPKPVVSQ